MSMVHESYHTHADGSLMGWFGSATHPVHLENGEPIEGTEWTVRARGENLKACLKATRALAEAKALEDKIIDHLGWEFPAETLLEHRWCLYHGMYHINQFLHANRLEDGRYTVHEGHQTSDRTINQGQPCGLTGLTVIKDSDGHAIRFKNLKEAVEEFGSVETKAQARGVAVRS